MLLYEFICLMSNVWYINVPHEEIKSLRTDKKTDRQRDKIDRQTLELINLLLRVWIFTSWILEEAWHISRYKFHTSYKGVRQELLDRQTYRHIHPDRVPDLKCWTLFTDAVLFCVANRKLPLLIDAPISSLHAETRPRHNRLFWPYQWVASARIDF